MKKYKIWLGESAPVDQFKHVLSLFERLGYKADTKWNKLVFEKMIFDCVYTYEDGKCVIRFQPTQFKEKIDRVEITLPELESLVTEFEQNKSL